MLRRSRPLILAALLLAGCAAGPAVHPGRLTVGPATPAVPRWTARANLTDPGAPDYRHAFPATRVNALTLTIAPGDWDAIMLDLGKLYGPRGDEADGQIPPATVKPAWVAATVGFAGHSWGQVGVRPKGSSTLKATWRDGSDKFPWKLDFSQYQPDQRFLGFRQLSFSNNWADSSLLRDALVNDVLEQAGLPAARTAFYDLTLDRGVGPERLGIYTAVEVVGDTLVPRVFGGSDGNLYQPEGDAAALAAGTRGAIAASFQKENNKKTGWGDVEDLYDALHAPARLTDPAAWRQGLERRFAVQPFLRWLAVSTAVQAWDAYGWIAHNYYLYNDPADHTFKWIGWDHNLDLDGPTTREVYPDRHDVGPEWPLIRFLLDDPVYAARYRQALADVRKGPFDPARVRARCEALATVLAPAMKQAGRYDDFRANVNDLEGYVDARAAMLDEYLAK